LPSKTRLERRASSGTHKWGVDAYVKRATEVSLLLSHASAPEIACVHFKKSGRSPGRSARMKPEILSLHPWYFQWLEIVSLWFHCVKTVYEDFLGLTFKKVICPEKARNGTKKAALGQSLKAHTGEVGDSTIAFSTE
jgi:hypothetical protein